MTCKTSILAAAVIAMVGSVHAAALSPSEVDDLVGRLENTYQARGSLEANFKEERQVKILKEPVVNEGKFWFTPPDKVRREITGKSPSTTVIDGNTMTIYYPNLKTAELYDLSKRPSLRDSLQALTAGLNFQRVRTYYNVEASKDGNYYSVTLTPKTSAFRKLFRLVTVQLDGNLTPVRSDIETARSEPITITYSNVRRDPINDSMFQFSPPAGTNITHPLGS
jgi:outer membrane lipoprotein-sorting protein